MQEQISIVLLAAGMSRRASGNKLLFAVSDGGMTVIEHLTSIALESDIGPVIVVLGHESDRMSRVLEAFLPAITVTVNDQYSAGMSESVKIGVQKALESHPENPIMIIPADCLLINPEDLRKVVMEYTAKTEKIAVASYEGRNGHPVVFSQELIPELLAINEETYGLKAVIKRHGVLQVETGNPGVLRDFDKDEDFQDYRISDRKKKNWGL